jgi:PAP2 superfamily
VANQFAAMPSLHFGWAVLVAATIIGLLRSRWRFLAIAHPVVTLLAIVATANHYWLDAAVALVLVALAGLLIRWWARRAAPAASEPTIALTPPVRPHLGRGPVRVPEATAPGIRTGAVRRSGRQDVSRCWRR